MIASANSTAWFPGGASAHAAGVDGVFTGIYIAAAVALVVVVGLAVVFLRMFGRRDGDPDQVPAGANNLPLMGLFVVLAVALAGFAYVAGIPAFVDQNVAPYGAYTVNVTARQGAWDFTYPNGHVADTLRVETGRPVKLVMTSEDVAQNLSIPALRLQQPILPGRTTEAWFAARDTGDFAIHTGGFSAATHDSLTARLMAMDTASFQAWLASVEDIFKGRTLAEVGELLYTQQGCMACHSLNGTRLVGPTFLNVYGYEFETTDGQTVLADDAYIRESILEPNVSVIAGYQPVMTPYAGKLDDREIEALIEFLKTLSDRGDTGDGTAPAAQEEN